MGELRSQKQQREQLVRALRAAGRSWVDVADVLRQRYRVNARVALRYAHGWSQHQAADEWNKRWPDELKTFKSFSCLGAVAEPDRACPDVREPQQAGRTL